MNEEAVALLTKATQLQPKRPLYHNNLAAALVEAGRHDEALAELLVTNNEAVAHYNLGCLLHRSGDDSLASTHFRQALDYDPTMTRPAWLVKLDGPQQPAAAEVIRVAGRPTNRFAMLPSRFPRPTRPPS